MKEKYGNRRKNVRTEYEKMDDNLKNEIGLIKEKKKEKKCKETLDTKDGYGLRNKI